MSYSGDPSYSSRDAVRFLLSDTSNSTGTELLADVEIDWLLTQNSNVYLAAAAGARTLGGREVKNASDSISVGPLSISNSGSDTSWYDLAKQLESRARMGLAGASLLPYSGGIDVDDKRTNETDTSWDKPWFRRGLMDHPEVQNPYSLTSTSS